jgi:hypothetical protein
MFTTLAAALSLAASLAIEVPYLPQTDDLCGGAAAAMVFRYWGDVHADLQDFAPLIDRRAGGIAADVLTAAVESRGWRTARVDGSFDALGARLRDGQPVIVLLPDRGDRYHYVVVTAVNADTVVVHDPAWGPSRPIRHAEFERAWQAAGFWSLVILPGARGIGTRSLTSPAADPPAVSRVTDSDACDVRLNNALDAIRTQGLDRADALLGEVRAQCPGAIGPLRELSGVRFAQRRWNAAVTLAREVLLRDPQDAYALDVLGSALFMQGDDIDALRAWNRIGKPRVNRLRIDGLHHTRYQMVAELMAIQPNMLLTAEGYGRARQRLRELPDQATTRLAVKPEADGFATVDVVVVEIAPLPRGPVEWAGAAAHTAANRTVDVSVPGTSGQGEVWSASWRWWNHRPGASIALSAPRVRGLPGVWRVEGSWESDTYDAPQGPRTVESRTHGGLAISDWLSSRVRYTVTTGLDAWGSNKAASIGGSLERVAFANRLTLSIGGTQWMPVNGRAAFGLMSAHVGARSSTELRGWVGRGELGLERVGDAAPLTLWPGAGEGQVRSPLLRAHPLLTDGVVDLSSAAAFARTVAFGTGELQRWLENPPLLRVGFAAFADVARASRQFSGGETPLQVDVGGGIRIKVPGTPGVLRADFAHGVRDGANALTFGWLF